MASDQPHPISQLLQARVPICLLLDLADPAGPHSSALYTAEGGWLDWDTLGRREPARSTGVGWADDGCEDLERAVGQLAHA